MNHTNPLLALKQRIHFQSIISQWRSGIIPKDNDLIEVKEFYEKVIIFLGITGDCDVLRSHLRLQADLMQQMIEDRKSAKYCKNPS